MDKYIIAQEMRNAGYDVEIVYRGVFVSLKNRKVTTSEIEMALEAIFWDVKFNVMRSISVYVN